MQIIVDSDLFRVRCIRLMDEFYNYGGRLRLLLKNEEDIRYKMIYDTKDNRGWKMICTGQGMA